MISRKNPSVKKRVYLQIEQLTGIFKLAFVSRLDCEGIYVEGGFRNAQEYIPIYFSLTSILKTALNLGRYIALRLNRPKSRNLFPTGKSTKMNQTLI